MDDLWSRIQQQNAEMDAQNALDEHERYVREQSTVVRRVGKGIAAPPSLQGGGGGGGGGYMQNYGGAQGLPSEAQMYEREAELDRQLELERSLVRGAQQDRSGGGGRSRKLIVPPTHGSLNRKGGGPQMPAEKENRGKISLLPGRGGADSVSNYGGGGGGGSGQSRRGGGGGSSSQYAPSTAGGRPAPSVAGSVTPSERLRRPVHFTHMMARDDATQIDMVLNPLHGIRDQMKRAGVEPKNHARDNVRALREMAAQKQQQQEAKHQEEEQRQRREQMLRERSLQRAQMTLHGVAEDGGYDDDGLPFAVHPGSQPPSRGASAGRRSTRPPPTASDAPVPKPPRPHAPGHVPAYLQRRKAEWQAEADEEEARARAAAECPPGLRLVGAEEKARILDKLAEERAKAMLELRNLPFVVKTTSTQLKKDRLEARLEEIQGAEEAYMKERVFVPADM